MKVAVIGGGTIGSAIAESLQRKGHKVLVTRRSVEKLKGLRDLGIDVSQDNEKAARLAEVIVIVLKPFDSIPVLRKITKYTEGKLVISMAAAVRISKIKPLVPGARVVRAMTNIAARVGGGYTVYSSLDLDTESEKTTKDILSCFGDTERVDEKYMDALTAMSGSGPAYIFTVIEAMVYAGLKVGLPRELALRSSYQTVLGAAKLVSQSSSHISELRDLVTTPGGVTIDALYELEDAGIRTAFMRAIVAATEKARSISAELDKYD